MGRLAERGCPTGGEYHAPRPDPSWSAVPCASVLPGCIQALFYLSRGVMVPLEHLTCGLAKATVGPNGEVFDWTRVTEGMFLVHSCKQHCRPVNATVAVKYHDYWFYIDDRDQESKATFLLMMELVHFSLGDVQYKGPMLTLPVGR